MPYLNETLRPEGELLSEYSLLTAEGLPNRIAMISGQPPNAHDARELHHLRRLSRDGDARRRRDRRGPGVHLPGPGADDRRPGQRRRPRLARLHGGHGGRIRARELRPPGLRAAPTSRSRAATRAAQNPFVYFHSLLDLGACSVNDVPLDGLDQGPEEGGDDAQLRLHLAEPLQRRRPGPVPRRRGDHGRAGTPEAGGRRRARPRPAPTRSCETGCRGSASRPRSRRTGC